MDRKRAIIFGVTGQDGSYLSELLLSKDYEVIGVSRRSSVDNTERIKGILDDNHFTLVEGDITDAHSVTGIIEEYQADECYNLAAQSHVGTSFKQPEFTFDVCAKGPLHILEAIRTRSPQTHFYQASTSEMFGNNYHEFLQDNGLCDKKFQDETVNFKPTSPYAIAKTAAHNLVEMYRKAYNLHASSGILFNHESERRGVNFVTRKITKWIGEFQLWRQSGREMSRNIDSFVTYNRFNCETVKDRIFCGMDSFPKLRLGNLDSYRDWGHAEDYVEMMWRMVNAETPDDYVIATGEAHTIREFLDEAFKLLDIDDWTQFVVVDPKFYRPSDVNYLCGLPKKAERQLGWKPKIRFKELVRRMVESDIGVRLEAKKEEDSLV